MASISEDTGEETPLQVCHFIDILTWNSFHLHVVFICKLLVIGTPKWGCNFHRCGWTFGSCLCLDCPFG